MVGGIQLVTKHILFAMGAQALSAECAEGYKHVDIGHYRPDRQACDQRPQRDPVACILVCVSAALVFIRENAESHIDRDRQ